MSINKQLPKGALAVSIEVGALSRNELLDECHGMFKVRYFPEQGDVFENMPISQEGKVDFYFVQHPNFFEQARKDLSIENLQDWLHGNHLKFVDPMVLLYYNRARIKSGFNIEFFQYTMWVNNKDFCFLCFQNPNWCFWSKSQKPNLSSEYWLPVIEA